MLKGKALPALLATGRVMGAYGITFAAIGGIFAAVDVRSARAGRPFPRCCNPTQCVAVQRSHAGCADARRRPPRTRQCTSENVRRKKDFWNGVLGGAAAGSVIGVRGARSAAMPQRVRAHGAHARRLPPAQPRRWVWVWAPPRRWRQRLPWWTRRGKACEVCVSLTARGMLTPPPSQLRGRVQSFGAARALALHVLAHRSPRPAGRRCRCH